MNRCKGGHARQDTYRQRQLNAMFFLKVETLTRRQRALLPSATIHCIKAGKKWILPTPWHGQQCGAIIVRVERPSAARQGIQRYVRNILCN
jgi:hypothetical protein